VDDEAVREYVIGLARATDEAGLTIPIERAIYRLAAIGKET